VWHTVEEAVIFDKEVQETDIMKFLNLAASIKSDSERQKPSH